MELNIGPAAVVVVVVVTAAVVVVVEAVVAVVEVVDVGRTVLVVGTALALAAPAHPAVAMTATVSQAARR